MQKIYKGNARTQICLLDENSYVYSLKHKAMGRNGFFARWRCVNMNGTKCQARCSTLKDRLKSARGEHNHGPTFCENSMLLLDPNFKFA